MSSPPDRIADFLARSTALLFEQFKSTNIADLVAGIAAQFQGLEDSIAALWLLLSIDPVTNDATSYLYGVGRGVQLDRIGKIVGQPRGSADDATYRLYLRARIRANKSSGGPDQILAVFLAMFPGCVPTYRPGGISSFTLDLVGVVLNPIAAQAAAAMLYDAEQAGVRGIVEWEPAATGSLFIFGGTALQGFGSLTSPTVGGLLAGAAQA